MKGIIWILFFGLGSVQMSFATGDSTHLLTFRDTIFIQNAPDIGSYFVHTIAPKQTLYSLLKFYRISQADLAEFNPPLQVRLPQIGDELRIPISKKLIRTTEPPSRRESYSPVIYRVIPGEGMYTIARKYFNLDPATIIRLNKLEGSTIYPDQLLILGWIPLSDFNSTKGNIKQQKNSVKVAESERQKENEVKTEINNKATFEASETKYFKKTERGVAFWHRDLKNSTGMYVLSNDAVPGSVISISNPMYNNTVYAKVVGSIPANTYSPDVMLIVSPEVAQKLGARDERFYAQISYYGK